MAERAESGKGQVMSPPPDKESDLQRTLGRMETQIQRMEEDVRDIKVTLRRLEPVLAGLNERLKSIPPAWAFYMTVLASVLAALAIK